LIVTESPAGIEAISATSPLPLVVPHVAPPADAHVQVAEAICAGNTSAICAPLTADGPLFATTIV
jgi:hypothetical protein